jgi:diaminopimelate epimerase
MGIPFVKMHGLGNDFVLLDERAGSFGLDPTALRRLADRRFGVGCDQVLSLVPARDPRAVAAYRVFNADGSSAEHCGNGVRCVARYLARRGEVADGRLTLEIGAGLSELELLADGRVRVDMGRPRFAPAAIPLAMATEQARYRLDVAGSTRDFGAVSMGNPHAVIEVAELETAPVAAIGSALQEHPAFPQRVNVGFMQVLDARRVRLRVFERGAGETLACGTGACAAVAIGRRWGRLGDAVTVELRGGTLEVAWDGVSDHPLWMTGPATFVFEGTYEP